MNSHLTEAEEMTRRYDLAERRTRRSSPTHPAPRRRHRLASGLRRVADRLEQ